MSFPFRSRRNMVERRAKKKTVTACPITAREKPIWLDHGEVNWVRRIGAFSWGRTKKLPWDEAIAAELAFAFRPKLKPAKRFAVSRSADVVGVSPAPRKGSLDADADIRAFTPRPPIFSGVKLGTTPFGYPRKVGATTDPRHGCAVNTAESASRLIRLHPALPSSGVALTGGDALPSPANRLQHRTFRTLGSDPS